MFVFMHVTSTECSENHNKKKTTRKFFTNVANFKHLGMTQRKKKSREKLNYEHVKSGECLLSFSP
jgi:hypothetical protein